MKLNIPIFVFGLIGFLICLVLGMETRWGSAIRLPLPQSQTVSPSPPILLANRFVADEAIVSDAILGQPIFVPTRSPAPRATVTESAAVAPSVKGLYALTGTAIVGETRLAFLRQSKDNKPMTVRVGSYLQGKRVTEITDNRVVLSENNETETLILVLPPPTARKATPPAATAPRVAAQPSSPQPVPPLPATDAAPMNPTPPTAEPPTLEQPPAITGQYRPSRIPRATDTQP
ncbi:MAG: hypothetical protein LBG61_07400 [Burkholderiales bacterium]|jgi:hypothetical protein|nr:hypothetical protein [Burkholderiales bacterium]